MDQKIQDLFTFLKGGKVEGVRCDNQPALTPDQAFTAIWFLQEHLRIIPENYEMCDTCKEIYDSNREGRLDEKSGKWYCDQCDPEIYG